MSLLPISAGREAKEDVLIELTAQSGQGLTLNLESSVATFYGEHLRQLIKAKIEECQLTDVAVRVKDQGALDWVVLARFEAAVRRFAPKKHRELLPPMLAANNYTVDRDRRRRSRLYLPGNQPDLMLNAGLFKPDGVILDLEDAVAPAQKDAAQLLVRNALRSVDFAGTERMVRINQLPRGLDDLPFAVLHNAHTILLPKAEKANDVLAVVSRIKELTDRPVWIMPILESALGIENAYAIASSHPHVCAITFGAEDFCRDIGAARSEAGTESFYARSRVVIAARAAGVQPIDTVYSDVENEEGMRQSVREAISLGFDGKGCIHPRQIAVIHDTFRPSDKELINAYKIKKAMDEATARGEGVVSLGSKMIDPPVAARAVRVLNLAELYKIDVAALAAKEAV